MPMSTTSTGRLTPQQFIAKWSEAQLSERAASQEHFLDLCALLGQPTPAGYDSTGAEYTFEKAVASVTDAASAGSKGERGFVDVWWRHKFAWEYKRKGKYKSLDEAYRQLCQYHEALENPPLLIVSDIEHIEIRTKFTRAVTQCHVIHLNELDQPEALEKLRKVFTDADWFKPATTPEGITEEVAEEFARLAQALRERGHEPHDAAHFLMKCMFCLFAEDVELLPSRLFSKMLKQWQDSPDGLTDRLTELFGMMASGGAFGFERIPWFNGGLFREREQALSLTESEIGTLMKAGRQDWSQVEPAIFGTLFERSLDPNKRAQIGAHYTSRDDILLVVEPVVMRPLRRRWAEVQAEVGKQIERRRKVTTRATKAKADQTIQQLLTDFMGELAHVRVLDPACGSGNFLYVAIQQILYLEKEVITFAAQLGVSLLPNVRPTQLLGLEVNPYAAELAQVVIWIGYLQWMQANGFNIPRDPILEPIETIEHRDAILSWADEQGNPLEVWQPGAHCGGPAAWPAADFIIGNPPFLGSRKAPGELGDAYIEAMHTTYAGDLPEGADLCCYWFERARRELRREKGPRCGLLATQGIRGGSSRRVLQQIVRDGRVFEAWSDREWVLEGAAVHISIVCFDNGQDVETRLDGESVGQINADLTVGADLTTARRLSSQSAISFQGTINSGRFDFGWERAAEMLRSPNPDNRSNFDVVRPWVNGRDITTRRRGQWIIDFGADKTEDVAALYERPFEYVRKIVKPQRDNTKYAPSSKYSFWQLWCPRHEMREALNRHKRFLATPRVTKHRLFIWLEHATLPDAQLIAFARSDDYFFGVLHSNLHELWARGMGTQLREAESGFRYTPTTCFETFPLPWLPGSEPADSEEHRRIAVAAKELDEQRRRWLNPPQWVDPIAEQVDAEDGFANVAAAAGDEARCLIRESAIQARAAKDKNLKKRTLTNLYNERPTWLALAHRKLDEAVLAAYAAVDPEGEWETAWAEVWQDTGAGQSLPEGHKLSERRSEIDQCVLANLLRLNQERGT